MSERPLLIVSVIGAPRSGSTLLARSLGQLDGVFCAGEIRKLWSAQGREDHRCGCGEPLADCAVWSPIIERLRDQGISAASAIEVQRAALRTRQSWVRGAAILRGAPGDRGRAYADLLGKTYRTIAEVTGARVIVDSSKKSDHAASIATVTGVAVRYVQLVRDPRGVVYSRYRRAHGDDAGRSRPLDAARRSASWIADNAAAAAVRSRHKDASMLVRYERFVTEPATVVAAIARLAGVDATDLPVEGDTIVLRRTTHAAHGNENRFTSGSIALRLDEAWRERLHPVDRAVVGGLTFPFHTRWRHA